MNKRIIQGIIFILITAVLSVFFLSRQPVYAAVTSTTYDAPENVRAVRYSNTSVRISWKADTNTDGYIIYRYDRSSKKYVRAKVIKDSSVSRWIDRKLKTDKVYQYKAASYKVVNGKKQVSALSDWVSARTYRRYSKSVNAQAPKVDKKKVNLGLCSSQKLKSKVVPTKYGKNKKKKPFSDKVRWYSREDDIYTLITDFKSQIQNIAEYYSIHRIGEDDVIYIELDDHANVVITPENADIGNLRNDIEKLLIDFPYDIRIEITVDAVEYVMWSENSPEIVSHVIFFFDNDCNEWPRIQIASHWTASKLYPH